MLKETVVEAERRTDLGKNASRRLRRQGKIPGVLYGTGGEVMALAIDPRTVESILHSEAGSNTLFGLKVAPEGELPGRVMIREHQVDPVTEKVLHADFVRVAMDRMIRVEVAIHTTGTAKGVKLEGGILDHPLREIELECLPGDIPERIEIDVTELELGKTLRVSDLVLPDSVTVITDPHKAVVAVIAPVVEAEPEAAAEVEAGAEAAPTEPEVIKKGKAGDADEDGEERGSEKK